MELLSRYRNLGPFTIDELVEAVNSVLRDRPEMRVTKRTIRFYVAQGVIPPPRGAPKYARYPFENVLTIVAIRRLQDQGEKLENSQRRAAKLADMDPQAAIAWTESLDRSGSAVFSPPLPAEIPAPMYAAEPAQALGFTASPSIPAPRTPHSQTLKRYELGREIALTVPADRDQREALSAARESIDEILREFHDTT